MSDVQQPAGKLVRLSGTIRNYKCTRAEASFFFSDADRDRMGVVAIAAGIAGLAGQAVATASYAADTDEDADYVEFDLNGQPIKGWVWRSPFKEGDAVVVAAEWQEDGHYEAGAIARPKDRVIALYPHCSRGTSMHIKNATKWGGAFILLFLFFFEFMFLWLNKGSVATYMHNFFMLPHLAVAGGIGFVFVLMVISLTRKWMPFVRLTEKLCRTLGMSDPANVDLVKSAKEQRRADDPGEYGTFYFRY